METIRELLATRDAADKLGARAISIGEATQLIDNRYVIARNSGRRRRRDRELARRLVIGRTDGGRILTLVAMSWPPSTHAMFRSLRPARAVA